MRRAPLRSKQQFAVGDRCRAGRPRPPSIREPCGRCQQRGRARRAWTRFRSPACGGWCNYSEESTDLIPERQPRQRSVPLLPLHKRCLGFIDTHHFGEAFFRRPIRSVPTVRVSHTWSRAVLLALLRSSSFASMTIARPVRWRIIRLLKAGCNCRTIYNGGLFAPSRATVYRVRRRCIQFSDVRTPANGRRPRR